MISVLGVPGYADPTRTPASHAPRAMASLPMYDLVWGSPPSALGSWADARGPVSLIISMSCLLVRVHIHPMPEFKRHTMLDA
jgi:hypothetical protein